MADQIRMDFDQLAQIAQRLYALGCRLDGIGSEIRGVHIDAESGGELKAGVNCYLSGVGYAVNSADIAGALGQLARAAGRVGDRAAALSSGVNRVAELFVGVETELMQTPDRSDGGRWQEGGVASAQEIDRMIAGFFSEYRGRRPSKREVLDFFKKVDLPEKLAPAVLATGNGLSLIWKENEAKNVAKSSWKPSALKIEPDGGDNATKVTFDPETGKFTETQKDSTYRDQKTLLAFGGSVSASESLLHGDFKESNEKYSLEADFDVVKVESHASYEGGLYSYKTGEDGKTYRTLSPGFKVEGGVSVSAIESKVSGEYELIDNVSVGGDVHVEAMSAAVDTSFGIGIVENELIASVKLDAEMNLAEAGGEVYVDAGGVKGTIGADVSAGIGAHAKVGYEKGKVNFDVGIGVGVGVSVRAELDISGLVDNLTNTLKVADDFINGASQFFGAIFG